MPIYEYRCTACAHQFQTLIRNVADTPTACPECGKPVRKKLSTFSASVAGAKTPCAEGACPIAPPGGGHRHGPACGCGHGKCPL